MTKSYTYRRKIEVSLAPFFFFLGCQQRLLGVLLADIRWEQRRSAPDVFYAGIYGDPAQPGPYVFRVRAQAGHSLPPHTHHDERTVTVLSGTYWSGVGETFDESRLEVFPAGSFYVIPAGVPHFSAVLEGEVEFQEAGVGPSSHDLVKAGGRDEYWISIKRELIRCLEGDCYIARPRILPESISFGVVAKQNRPGGMMLARLEATTLESLWVSLVLPLVSRSASPNGNLGHRRQA